MKKLSYRPVALAMAMALGGLQVPAVHAALVTSETQPFTMGSGPATDTCGPLNSTTCTAANTSSTALATVQATTDFNKFNATAGVLTGVTIGLSSSRTQTVSGSVTNPITTGAPSGKTTSTASGTSGGSLSATGATTETLGTISHSKSSTNGATTITSSKSSPSTTNATLAVTSSLDTYVGDGTGTVAVTGELSGVQATSVFANGKVNSTKSSANYSVSWAGDLTITYNYLEHADASFDGADQLVLNLNFGNVLQFVTPAALAFSIFNALNVDGVGLDLDAILPSGDSGKLTTNLGLFSNLEQGGSNAFQASFDTTTLGNFSASYALTLSDADVGAASSRFNNYGLTLNLTGNVIAQQDPPTNGVPEPATLALVGAGLFGMALGRRRRPG